jgi:hypothetical protein
MTPEREADIRRIIPYWTPTTAGTAIEDLLAEIDRLRKIPDKDLDGLIDEFMINGYPLNPEGMKRVMRGHFGPVWAEIDRLRDVLSKLLEGS